MQVDFRPRYDLSSVKPANTDYVRKLGTTHVFFQASGNDLVKNYASAKYEVARWLSGIGMQNLYQYLERIQNGEQFESVFTD